MESSRALRRGGLALSLLCHAALTPIPLLIPLPQAAGWHQAGAPGPLRLLPELGDTELPLWLHHASRGVQPFVRVPGMARP